MSVRFFTFTEILAVIGLIVCLITGIYALFCLGLVWIWQRWPSETAEYTLVSSQKVSVLIPVRNEAENIVRLLEDLENQSLSHDLFEVLVLNDSSTDETTSLVEAFAKNSSLNLFLLHIPPSDRNNSPKKRAISFGIQQAAGEIIVTTDGDCRVSKEWLQTYAAFFEGESPVFASAPVLFMDTYPGVWLKELWVKIQQIEFASLIVSGAVSMKSGFPNMCSGANIGYLKTAFYEVNGFEGNDHLASGDDEFLMHKMAKHFPGKVKYLKSEAAIVKTYALPGVRSFYQQRKRWAGKWPSYESFGPKLMAMFIFVMNAAFIYALMSGHWYAVAIKAVPEFFFLAAALQWYRKGILIVLIPLVQLIYPFYVVFFGLSSLKKSGYSWKNRELS